MRPIKRAVITVAIIGAIAYFGYQWWKNYEFKFDYKASGRYFRINGLHDGGFEFYIDITSHYSFDITITSYDIMIQVNGKDLIEMKSPASYVPQKLTPEKPSRLTLSSTFDPAVLAKSIFDLNFLKSLATSKTDTKITFIGTVSVNAGNLINFNSFPIDITYTLAELLPA